MPESNTAEAGGISEEILVKTVDTLRRNEANDISLLEILSKRIVTLAPATDAIEVALKEIEALAVERGEKVD